MLKINSKVPQFIQHTVIWGCVTQISHSPLGVQVQKLVAMPEGGV